MPITAKSLDSVTTSDSLSILAHTTPLHHDLASSPQVIDGKTSFLTIEWYVLVVNPEQYFEQKS